MASTRLIIQRIVGRDRTIGAFINFGADWMAPGEIMFGNRGAVVLGELDGAMTPRLAALHAVMRDFEPDAITTPDIWSYLWGKLGYGAMLFAQALGQKGIADCLARPELLPLWRRLGEEAIVVARPRASNRAASTAMTSRHSGLAPARRRRERAWPRWSRSTAPARRRIPACGATLPSASAAPRWTCRSPPSPRSAPPRHRLPRHAQAGRDDPRGGGGPPAMTDDNLLELSQAVMAGRVPVIHAHAMSSDGRDQVRP